MGYPIFDKGRILSVLFLISRYWIRLLAFHESGNIGCGLGGHVSAFLKKSLYEKGIIGDYSIRMALIMPSCPGLLIIRARPASVRMTAPLVRRFRRT